MLTDTTQLLKDLDTEIHSMEKFLQKLGPNPSEGSVGVPMAHLCCPESDLVTKALNSFSFACAEISFDGLVHACNPALADLLRVQFEELSSFQLLSIVAPADQDRVRQALADVHVSHLNHASVLCSLVIPKVCPVAVELSFSVCQGRERMKIFCCLRYHYQ